MNIAPADTSEASFMMAQQMPQQYHSAWQLARLAAMSHVNATYMSDLGRCKGYTPVCEIGMDFLQLPWAIV